jgi:AcrR family transcriptional regulator
MSTKVKRRPRTPKGSPGRPVPAGSDAATSAGSGTPDPRGVVIRRAAFAAFVEHGVAGATTDEIARRARVSKREIYRLFGSKEALFSALVRERASLMRHALEPAPPTDSESALRTLERFGHEFLALLTSPSTIDMYRLVIGEAARLPELGRELDAQGRGTVWAALTAWMADAARRGALAVPDVERAAGSFMALLMGDLPVRLMLGAAATPSDDDLGRRAALARAGFVRLWLAPVS